MCPQSHAWRAHRAAERALPAQRAHARSTQEEVMGHAAVDREGLLVTCSRKQATLQPARPPASLGQQKKVKRETLRDPPSASLQEPLRATPRQARFQARRQEAALCASSDQMRKALAGWNLPARASYPQGHDPPWLSPWLPPHCFFRAGF